MESGEWTEYSLVMFGLVRSLAAALIVVCAAIGPMARADGGFFGRQAEVEPTIPVQRAVVSFIDQVESLVVESKLEAQPGDYAWIVPMPSEPIAVKAFKSDDFDDLFQRGRPYVDDPTRSGYSAVIFSVLLAIVLAIILARYVRPNGGGAACGVGAGLGCIWFILLLVGFGLTTKVGCSKDEEAVGKSVGTVGSYDVSVVRGKTGDAVIKWLRDRRMLVPATASKVLDAYAEEGWYFLAIKYTHSGTSHPHPLLISFHTQHPLYPMRLTGVQKSPLRLEILFFGITAFASDRLETWRIEYDEPSNTPHGRKDTEPPLPWDNLPVATYMRGDLPPSQMQTDFEFTQVDRGKFAMSLYPLNQRLQVYLQRMLPAVGFCIWIALMVAFLGGLNRFKCLLVGAAIGIAIGGTYLVYSLHHSRFVDAEVVMPAFDDK